MPDTHFDTRALPLDLHDDDVPIFEARFAPRPSLSARGATWLTVALGVATAVLGSALVAFGAWIALPFVVADVGFALVLLLAHRTRRPRDEHVRVDRGGLQVTRYDHRGRPLSREALPLYGLRLLREEDEEFGLLGLSARRHGTTIPIGRDLPPAERAVLAEAMTRAMAGAGCAPWVSAAPRRCSPSGAMPRPGG